MRLFIFLLFTASIGTAQSYQPPAFEDSSQRIEKIKATQAKIDSLFKQHAAKNNLPALVYGIVADGKLLYTGSTGYADVDKKIPATTATAFRIASMTKSFTAMAIVKLRDEGKLTLDDPASKYIAQMKGIKHITQDAPVITIKHLLTHTAGFPEDNPWGDRQLADTDADLLHLIGSDISFSNVPGMGYEYSNLGFALLGKIVTVVSGRPYQQYITEAILKPLGMYATYWEYKEVPAAALAHGYRWQNGTWMEEALLSDGAYGAMGGLMTTMEDFSKYMALHMAAWPPRSGKENAVIKRSSLREMQTAGVFSGMNPVFRFPDGRVCGTASLYAYGLGWVRDCDGKVWIGHSGGLPGFGSNWRFYPDYGIGIVCFANRTYAPMGSINLLAMDTIMKLAGLKPRLLPASAVLTQRATQLVQLLPTWKEAKTTKIFAENFFADRPLDSLKSLSVSLFEKAGAVIEMGPVHPENNLRGSFVIKGEKANIEVFFTLTPEPVPLIQQLEMRQIKK